MGRSMSPTVTSTAASRSSTAAASGCANGGRRAPDHGEFSNPHGLTFVTGNTDVIVADRENSRLQLFDRNGAFKREWTGAQDAATTGRVFSVAAGADGSLYVGIRRADYDTAHTGVLKLDREWKIVAAVGFDRPAIRCSTPCTTWRWAGTARFTSPKRAPSGSSSFVQWPTASRILAAVHMAMASRLARTALFALAVSGYVAAAAARVGSAPQQPAATPAGDGGPATTLLRATLDTYCVTCHNQRLKTAGLALDTVDAASPHTNPEIWERVIARLRAGSMPPAGRPRPDAATYAIGRRVARSRTSIAPGSRIPMPGPRQRGASPQSHAVQQRGARSVRARPAGLRREVAAARRRDRRRQLRQFRRRPHDLDGASRALSLGGATGDAARRPACRRRAPALETFEIPLHVVQDDRQDEDLPFGSRGGIAVRYEFPGRRRVLDQGAAAAAVSGLPDGHGLAATARRAARRQADQAIRGRRQGARHARRRRATPATASPASPARPNGKPTCS